MAEAVAKQGTRRGDFLGGKYLLGECLGIGGMGEVYRAQNVSLGRHVAIKILSREFSKNEDDVLRFLREARAAAAVRHPNVVDVLDVARDDDGTPFIVQELLSGQDLEQHLQASGGRLSPAEIVEVMIPVADAVGVAHQRGLVHRDLKPANIFLAREGSKIVPKVLDFGAALYKTVGGLSAKEQRMLIGTPHYMAPEQITTKTDVDARADVWALGIIMYELIVGETPFEAETGDAVLRLVKTRHVPLLRDVARKAPEDLERLVARCTQREKSKRLADATAVREELTELKNGLRSSARMRPETVAETRSDSEAPPPPSTRIPSLVLTPPKTPTRRRGSALLTLSSPDSEPPEADLFAPDPPASVERPIEAAARAEPRIDDRREPAPEKKREEPRRVDARRDEPAREEPKRDEPAREEPKRDEPKRDQGARNLMELDDFGAAGLELELESPPPRSSPTAPPQGTPSSLPPVLDPRAARIASSSVRPPPSPSPVPPPETSGVASDRTPRPSRDLSTTQSSSQSALTPPIAPSRARVADGDGLAPLTAKSRLALAATVLGPATVLFVALHFAGFATAPLAHAMRGDSTLASGVFAVVTLICAAALGVRSFSTGSRGLQVAGASAVVLGIVMIIVTFGAIETVETGSAPAAAAMVPFLAPLAPLALAISALKRAREHWGMRYDRREALTFAALASLVLLLAVELSPVGVVRELASRPVAGATGATPPSSSP